jgi:hypothetical protein
MKNVKEILENIQKFTEFAEKRAYELFEVNIHNNYRIRKYYLDNTEFDYDNIQFTFRESNYDIPETECLRLELKDLELSDEKWNEYITTLKDVRDKKIEEELLKKEERKIKLKEEQFEKLKKELNK